MKKTLAISIPVVLAAAMLTMLIWHRMDQRDDAGRPYQSVLPPHGRAILLEAEAASGITRPFEYVEDVNAAGTAGIGVADAEESELAKAKAVIYNFDVKTGGKYRLWLRAWWRDGCGNSINAGTGKSAQFFVGNDGTYSVWHWVKGPVFLLESGQNVLRLTPREPGARIDQILLVDNSKYYPMGILSVSKREGQEATPEPSSFEDARPAWISEGREARPAFSAAVGGAYQGGAEAIMLAAGVPYERLQEETIVNLDTLRRYDVIWLAAPQVDADSMWKALNAYVKEGGTAIIEIMHELRNRRETPERTELFAPAQIDYNNYIRNVTASGNGSSFFQDIKDRTPLCPDTGCYRIYGDLDSPVIEPYGMIYRNNNLLGPVFIKKRLGKGRLYVLAIPISFSSMWRDTRFDGVGRRILLDAVDGRYTPIFDLLRWTPTTAGKIHFSDDFMREPGESGGWEIEKGTFLLTGEKPADKKHIFTLKGTGGSWTVAGYPMWDSYRVSASVLAQEGAAGIWLSTRDKRRISLTLDGKKGVLAIAAWTNRTPKILHEAKIPGPLRGWRRISILERGGAWLCYIDNQELFSYPAQSTVKGRCGLVVLEGSAYFDDVSTVDTSVLTAGSDRTYGEEGSMRSRPFSTFGLEPRTIYDPLWFLRPDPSGRHAFRTGIPTYVPSLLIMDGKILGTMPADPEGPLVYLPEGEIPRRELTLSCPGWRDYTFAGQMVEWYETEQPWEHRRRWSCDKRWQWTGVDTEEPSILWYRHRLEPPYCISVQAAPAAEFEYGKEKGRDLNFILSGNGENLREGIIIRTGSAGEEGCSIRQGGNLLGEAVWAGLPKKHALHHRWFEMKVVVDKTRIRYYYEGRLALDVSLSQPVQPGRIGFWTENNSIRVARLTLSISIP